MDFMSSENKTTTPMKRCAKTCMYYSGCNWDCLPREIQLYILLKMLPVDLNRMKFASKSLYDLISSREFVYEQLAHTRSKSLFGGVLHSHLPIPRNRDDVLVWYSCWDDDGGGGRGDKRDNGAAEEDCYAVQGYSRKVDFRSILGKEYELIAKHSMIYFESSCDGLLLAFYKECSSNPCQRLWVINLVTRRATRLPCPPLRIHMGCSWLLVRNPRSNEYKVVGVSMQLSKRYLKGHAYRVFVYNLGSCRRNRQRRWEVLEFNAEDDMHLGNPIVCGDGKLVWLAKGNIYGGKYRILCMELEDDNKAKTTVIPGPPGPPTVPPFRAIVYAFVAVNGWLASLPSMLLLNDSTSEIWVMKRKPAAGEAEFYWIKEHIAAKRMTPAGLVGITSGGNRLMLKVWSNNELQWCRNRHEFGVIPHIDSLVNFF